MRSITIIIPTLTKALGDSVGQMAKATAGCPVEVLVVHDTKRQGFTKTVNRGIRQAPAENDICLLNDDISWFQWGWLAILRRALYLHSESGLVGPTGDCGAKRIAAGRLGGSGTEVMGHISFWCVLMKREMLDVIGLLDPSFIHYNSDSWYCVQVKRSPRWNSVWVKSVFLVHNKHGSGKIAKWRTHDIEVYRRKFQ